MTQLEEELYKEILSMLQHDKSNIEDYLNGIKTPLISSWQQSGIDDKYSRVFGSQNFTFDDKIAIKEMFVDFIEGRIASILRLFESDIDAIEGYNNEKILEEFDQKHPNWRGGLIVATDLQGNLISEGGLYEGFIAYTEEKKANGEY